ncbi:helix-turn-helix domain-containing protein [Oricola sp.]|uniref:helix-turn-helix domain-containing protein n=1 Tax=Oricola sp. TaxID=1979950 RepID=UPI0025D30B87|nr:helix-turn-helix domain-containing protein [Oricola sp.]MCI5078252.1 helix-turn-helix domain-containing protein [Oricola sp.]
MSGPRYSIIPADAVVDKKLSRLALHVLAALGTHADNNGWCIVRHTTLAEKLDSTKESIRNALRELDRRGYIRRRERRGSNGARLANFYQVVMDREPSEQLLEDAISDAPPTRGDGGDPHAQMQGTPTPTCTLNKNDPFSERPSANADRRARGKRSVDRKPRNVVEAARAELAKGAADVE